MFAEEAKTTSDESRLIPPYHMDAETPAGVYRLHDIIPESEFNAIPIASLLSAGSNEERRSLLPFNQSEWIKNHLSGPKPSKQQLLVLSLDVSALRTILTRISIRVGNYSTTLPYYLRSVHFQERSLKDKS